MTRSVLLFASLLAFIAVCSAHLCLVFPPQRGGLTGIFTPLDPICNLNDAPCGDAPAGPATVFKAGEVVNISMLKNADHFYAPNPGAWALYGWSGNTTHEIAYIPDRPDPDLSWYNVTVAVPTGVSGSYIVQAVYYTGNPQIPNFYQCADVLVTNGENDTEDLLDNDLVLSN